jgi:hypothetical protein
MFEARALTERYRLLLALDRANDARPGATCSSSSREDRLPTELGSLKLLG